MHLAQILAIMEGVGYPKDVIGLIGNLYTNSTTSFHGSHIGTTPLIQLNKWTIQGDTLNPYLFIIFLDPLRRWLEKDNLGYHFNTSIVTCNTTSYADDPVVIGHPNKSKLNPTTFKAFIQAQNIHLENKPLPS